MIETTFDTKATYDVTTLQCVFPINVIRTGRFAVDMKGARELMMKLSDAIKEMEKNPDDRAVIGFLSDKADDPKNYKFF